MDEAKTDSKRDKAIRVRWTKNEVSEIHKRARAAGLSRSDFIRHAALGTPIKVVKFSRLHPAELGQIKRLGNLLNQIARAMHRGRFFKGTMDHLDEVLSDVKAITVHQVKQWGPKSPKVDA